MRFMVKWRVHPDKREAAFNAFAQMTSEDDKRDLGSNIKLIGRWHDLSQFAGVAICETDDAQAVANWVLNWTNVCDIETAIAFNDEEARAIGRNKMAEVKNLKATVAAN